MVRRLLACLLPLLAAACTGSPAVDVGQDALAQRPHVLLIVADDLGYSDIAPFGGEIETPNLSRLAQSGVRLTQLHSAPSCSPSRAMLFSGADNHIAGLGAMAEHIPAHYRGQRGFEGALSPRVASLAERFSDAGYRTAMSGKWHLGMADGERPAQRGFDASFALLQGAANHFGDGGFGAAGDGIGGATYVENDQLWTPEEGFYSSDVIAAKLIEQLNPGGGGAPFFAYLSFTAPHSPLQALPEDIERYAERYSGGWGELAQARIEGMLEAGVLPDGAAGAAATVADLQSQWDALTPDEKAVEARRMAIYAAMVDRMDQNIGRVLDALVAGGELDNTIILFISDNGPAGEDPRAYAVVDGFTERYQNADNSLTAMGNASSFVLQDPRWASAIAAPSRLFKAFVTEGGTRVPAILSASGLADGTVVNTVADLRDIAPTLLAMTGTQASSSVGGVQVAAIEGQNLLPWLGDESQARPAEPVAFGFNGQGLVRFGQWKALRLVGAMGDGQWHLYDTGQDPGERIDRRADQPELFVRLMATWQSYVERHQINEQADLGQQAPR